MAGYINPDGKAHLVTGVFGNVNGATVRAKSLWVNKDGSPSCIYREGGRDMYVLGIRTEEEKFSLAYSSDLENFRICSITMPSDYTAYEPNSIIEIVYSEELQLFVALGYNLPEDYTTGTPLRWYLMYSEDGKNWEVSLANSYAYYSTDVRLKYDKKNHLFFVMNKGPSTSSSTAKFYFYSSLDGKTWTEIEAIAPTNASNTKTYTAKNIMEALVPGDGYIYLSGVTAVMFYDGSKYHRFLRTKDGINYEMVGEGVSQTEASEMYGSRSLLYHNGIYYSLDDTMFVKNPNTTSSSVDYYNVGIHISEDLDVWEYVPLDVSSSSKNWTGSAYDGFFVLNDSLYCSLSKEDDESYVYKLSDSGDWAMENIVDNIMGKTYSYLYIPVSSKNLVLIGNKWYRTNDFRLSSTEDGSIYVEESEIEISLRDLFGLTTLSLYITLAVNSAS